MVSEHPAAAGHHHHLNSQPWNHSGPGWMGLWAPWSGWRRPCPWQGAGLDGL